MSCVVEDDFSITMIDSNDIFEPLYFMLDVVDVYKRQPLSKLRDLGYVSREVPFGESPKKSKKGIYHINDSLLRFHYQFIAVSYTHLACKRSKSSISCPVWTEVIGS